MRVTRRAVHRSDANSAALVKVARKLGMLVYHIGRPVDLLVFRGVWYPVETKGERGVYTEDQRQFLGECVNRCAPMLTWRTTQDVIDFAEGSKP
jgi:hypothetical protein